MNIVKILQRSRGHGGLTGYSCIALIRSRHIQSSVDVDFNGDNSPKLKKQDVYFKNVKLVSPQILEKYLYAGMKLKFVEEEEKSNEPGIELLRNIASNYDYWIVRSHQNLFLYYRLQMMLQRLQFLKTIGLTPRQKLRQIQKNPPLLLFSFTNDTFKSSMVYLRGMLPHAEKNFIHIFHPVTRRVSRQKTVLCLPYLLTKRQPIK